MMDLSRETILAVFVGVMFIGQTSPKLFCKDEYQYHTCRFYKIAGYCEAYASDLHVTCPVTCGLCDYGVTEKCVDKDGPFNCQYLKSNGVCRTHAHIMANRCAKSCNLCDAQRKCKDTKCPADKICILNRRNEPTCECPKYCPYKQAYKKLGKVCASNKKTYKDVCHMHHHSCREQTNLTVLFYGSCYMTMPCEDGKNEHDSGACATWKKMGFCKRHPSVMTQYCKKTCNFCEGRVSTKPIKDCKSRFGCCWDGTPAPDPKYGSCKKCADKYLNFCTKFINLCNSNDRNNLKFMKTNCPVSCGYCLPAKRREIEIQIFSGSGKRLYTTKFKNT